MYQYILYKFLNNIFQTKWHVETSVVTELF